ncbi:MAG TPA: CofH family radical SAM protein [Candidatus Poseidoniaceae archaeon]|nr:MAG TPA: CofH family radical SAM protein [Candidatus Poseidoniales archaeon]DAC70564.1 MAG TPA: CofH family radical SAM protein [Candidatus Poseidoniales archaeon]HII31123.1 CofH family radical SAM protein [Candidatus Poseidoniaceae archaeon]|tara:strand:+ start:3649 stop:4833 length:1185 start_codon:yes stop_codon:yes gene_type:complete
MAWQETLQRIVSSNETFRLTVEETIELYNDAPLHQLMAVAHHRRCLHNPSNEVTYLVDRNINYTNVCTINCQFCSFYRPPGHEETYTQSYDEIHDRIHELEAIGGSRILMQGGVNPALEFDWYIDLIKALRERHPTIDLDCFSPIEIEGIAEVTQLSTQTVLEQLKDAGMHGLPGGGAEMLVESVRKDVSPKKGHPDNWLRVMKEAQLLGLTTSATNVIGFGESNADRVQHLHRIREQQEEIRSLGLPGFTSFIAWPVQLESNTFGKRNRGQNRFERGAGSTEYLRHVAIARLFLDNVDHIQASWPTMGMGIAQMALLAGADDAGSTMMEENVVSASGTTKFSATEYELQLSIQRAGFIPKRRNSDYDLLETPNALVDAPETISQPPRQVVELV